MEVSVNNHIKEIASGSALVTALEPLVSKETKGVAVAVNNSVVQKAKWNEYILHEGDKITIIKATQGG